MTTTTLNPTADTYLSNSAATTNYGSATTVQHGAYAGGIIRHSLVKFDLSSITSSDICNSATLSVWLALDLANSDCTFSIHRLLRNWVENQATWQIYSTGNNWGTAGGTNSSDIDTTAMGVSGTVSSTSALGTEIQIIINTTEMKKMYDGTNTNYGWLIKSTSETESDIWGVYSREYATSTVRPKLVVETSAPISSGVPRFRSYIIS